jgi:DNA-binding response OmpR family regulator
VHVRRIRSKLGPDLAQHLETVRGVGYLWKA